MIVQSIAIHSHKGGVGKSTLSVNIALELAKSNKVVLIDSDLSGPSIQTFFPQQQRYFNDYLIDDATLEDVLNEFTDPLIHGKFFYCLSDPSHKALDQIIRIDKKTATIMLRQLISLTSKLADDYDIDYLIIDTSPGINITTANAFVATDNILFVNKLSNADIIGSANMIAGIMEYIDNRAFMVANQIPEEKMQDDEVTETLLDLIEGALGEEIGSDIIEIIGILPMDFSLHLHEFETAMDYMKHTSSPEQRRTKRLIYALDRPDSQFCDLIRHIISRIFPGS